MSSKPGYLLDTNVLSELRLKRADPRVRAFIGSLEPTEIFISVMSLGEIRKGIEKKDRNDPADAAIIAAWANGLQSSFADRILEVDLPIATSWGRFSAGRTRPIVDTLLAATAVVRNLVLVTRNTSDFLDLPVEVINPWLP